MHCRRCASPLEKPGDYCLVCHEENADTVVIEVTRSRTTITMIDEEEIVGETTITTVPEDGQNETVERRNYVERIVDEIHRKRPESVHAAGNRTILRGIRDRLHCPCYRTNEDAPVETVLERRTGRALDVIDRSPADKIGGSHSTLIGGRTGMRAIYVVADHPHVKKVIPGPIDAGGTGSQSGLRAKVTRADNGGNVRMLLRDGSSVQENRIVTTARDRELGERIRADLNDALEEAELT